MQIWSMEQFFSYFNYNGGDKIDAEEANNPTNAKNSIFSKFTLNENMTLESFKQVNAGVYREYEEVAKYDVQEKINELHGLSSNIKKEKVEVKENEKVLDAWLDPSIPYEKNDHDREAIKKGIMPAKVLVHLLKYRDFYLAGQLSESEFYDILKDLFYNDQKMVDDVYVNMLKMKLNTNKERKQL